MSRSTLIMLAFLGLTASVAVISAQQSSSSSSQTTAAASMVFLEVVTTMPSADVSAMNSTISFPATTTATYASSPSSMASAVNSDNSSSSSPSPSSSLTSAAASPSQSPMDASSSSSTNPLAASISIANSSSFPSSPSSTTSSAANGETTMAPTDGPGRVVKDSTYIPMVAAIVSGFGLLLLTLLLFLSMALAYRHIGKKDSLLTPLKKPRKGDAGLYAVLQPQSAQNLVSAMSVQSFGSSPSDARLDSHLSPGNPTLVHYNRGYDIDNNPSGQPGSPYDHDDGFRPIQIGGQVDRRHSKPSSRV